MRDLPPNVNSEDCLKVSDLIGSFNDEEMMAQR